MSTVTRPRSGVLFLLLFGISQAGQPSCRGEEVEEADVAARVKQLVRELDHDEYQVRESAQRALTEVGPAAADLLAEAHAEASAEVQFRIRQILIDLERKRLTGKWQLVRWETDGEAFTGREDVVQVEVDGWKSEGVQFAYRLNPLTKPKQIDWTRGKNVFRGIYKIEGDRLILCLETAANRPRPDKFETEQGDGLKLHTRQRVTEE